VLRAWWKRSRLREEGLAFADLVESMATTEGLAQWPNWFVAPRAARPRTPRSLFARLFGSLWLNAKLGVQATFNVWVLTLPGCFLMLAAWYFGWNNSFYKVYEEHALGFATGLFGVFAFIAAMFYVPLAQARQAATGNWRSFYQFGLVWRLVRQRPFGCAGLAALYALANAPLAVLQIARYFLVQGEGEAYFAALSDAELVQFLNRYFLAAGFLLFPAYVLLRLAAARVYAAAVLREVRAAEGPPALGWTEREALVRLELAERPEPARRYLLVRAVGWTASRMGRATAAVLCFVLWFSLAAQVFVAQFVNYVPVRGWLNQPLVQLPWIRYVPPHLLEQDR
jgi:hypothetical protein